MWMTFGSWFGGMWMLKLDPATGLRDYDTTYDTVTDQSDAYYGIKIAGGYGNSGEGSYLIHANGYWYLFASYGALQQKGGYQIRMFRSKDITGPYVDQHGNTAVSTEPITSNWTSDIGVKLMGSTQWSGSTDSIEVAQGHNSALVDDDGTVYLVYHTRFSNRGEEHEVRVRELLPTEDQWLVAAPYAYSGVTADAGGYDSNVLAGQYELVMHDKASYFMGATSSGTDSSENMGVNKPVNITLNEGRHRLRRPDRHLGGVRGIQPDDDHARRRDLHRATSPSCRATWTARRSRPSAPWAITCASGARRSKEHP